MRGNRYQLNLSPMAALKHLRSLDLCWVSHLGIKPLLKLKKMRTLGINSSRSFASISQMKLTSLEISNGHLNQRFLGSIAKMISLKSLKIWVGGSRSQPANIDVLSNLRGLESLEFRDAWKLSDISVVAKMKKLRNFAAPFPVYLT